MSSSKDHTGSGNIFHLIGNHPIKLLFFSFFFNHFLTFVKTYSIIQNDDLVNSATITAPIFCNDDQRWSFQVLKEFPKFWKKLSNNMLELKN